MCVKLGLLSILLRDCAVEVSLVVFFDGSLWFHGIVSDEGSAVCASGNVITSAELVEEYIDINFREAQEQSISGYSSRMWG